MEFASGWHCYLLLCEDGSYYCGITNNLNRRLRDHASRRGSVYTEGRRPTALVWTEPHKSRATAARRESKLKKWSGEKKRALAEGKDKFKGLGNPV